MHIDLNCRHIWLRIAALHTSHLLEVVEHLVNQFVKFGGAVRLVKCEVFCFFH